MGTELSSIVITIFSTASGIGKTVTATNFAAGLAREGYTTCLVDLDLQYGDVCNYLHLEPERTIADAQRTLDAGGALRVQDYLTEYAHGGTAFSVLAAPHTIEEAYAVTGPHLMQVLRAMDYFEFIVVDTRADFSDLNIAALDASTIITYLCVADFVPVIKNLKNGYETIRRFGYDVSKIRPVLNRSDSQTLIDPADVETILGQTFYHRLANDFRATQKSIEDGCPLVLTDSGSRFRKDLWELVGRYTNRQPKRTEEAPEKKGGWLRSWLRR